MTDQEERGFDSRGASELDQLLNALGSRLAEDGSGRRRPGILTWGGAAAGVAAALAALLVGISGRQAGTARPSDSDTALNWDVSADQSFAVFSTTDDDMLIIWILGENR